MWSGTNWPVGPAVHGGEVVPDESGEGLLWGGPGECAVGPVLIVEVDEPVVGEMALVF